MSITEPLRLAAGPESQHQGYGCIMNIISWENGDDEITDLPRCADPMIARFMWQINDTYCNHVTSKVLDCEADDCEICTNHDLPEEARGCIEVKLLCAECSIKMIRLGHRTVDTFLSMEEANKFYPLIMRDALENFLEREDDFDASIWVREMLELSDSDSEAKQIETRSRLVNHMRTMPDHSIPHYKVCSATLSYSNYLEMDRDGYDMERKEECVQQVLTSLTLGQDQIEYGHYVMDRYLAITQAKPPRLSVKSIREAYAKMRGLIHA